MKRRFTAILIIVLLLAPLAATGSSEPALITKGDTGSEVYAIQRRLNELGYLNYRPTGKFSDMTSDAVRKFQALNNMTADGTIGNSTYQALFSTDAVRNTANPAFDKVIGRAHTGTNYDKGVLSAWATIDKLFPVGETVNVTDYNTEIEFKLKRVGGTNSAQVVTASETDFNNYIEIFGGGETWEHRAVLVTIGGTNYAASLFGMPTHSEPLNDSGMSGYTILYFNTSKTDVMALSDAEHDQAIIRVS